MYEKDDFPLKVTFLLTPFEHKPIHLNMMRFGMKTRSLDLSRVRRHFQKMSGRQTDTIFFSKALFKRLFTPPSFFSAIQSRQKRDKKP